MGLMAARQEKSIRQFSIWLPAVHASEWDDGVFLLLLLLLLWGVIGEANDVFSGVIASPLDDHCCRSDAPPVPPALELTFACALQMGWGLLDVSFVLNKQGGGRRDRANYCSS